MPRSAQKTRKPQKPYPSYPLTAHNNGQWCKKIRGKVYFFGVWATPDAALDEYLRVAADLHAGRQPRTETISPDQVTVKELCNHYLTHQLRKVETGEVNPRSFEDYRRTTESFAKSVGLGRPASDLSPTDFELYRQKIARRGLTGSGRGLGVHALTRAITIVRSIFHYAYEINLIDKPVKYGQAFERPSAALKRKSRHASELANGKRLFTAPEIQALLRVAETPVRAMILLGINGGFGNTDCAHLPLIAIDFEDSVVEFDRPKTGIERVVPLWPETVEALGRAVAKRPKPVDSQTAGLVFLTESGYPYVRDRIHNTNATDIERVVTIDGINQKFSNLLRSLGLKRKGISFYTLRHTFRTWADEVKDQHAIHRIMGHVIPGMSGIYVEEISLDRLRAVTEHVRKKLFPPEQTAPAPPQPPAAV